MILSRERIEAVLSGEPLQRYIFDHPDMYGWVCGHLADDAFTLQYSSLCIGGSHHRTLFQRGHVYPLQEAYKSPILGHVKLICIHRADVREVESESLEGRLHSLVEWATRHDREAQLEWIGVNHFGHDRWRMQHHLGGVYQAGSGITLSELQKRPHERYSAWVLHYEAVTP